jgi:L-lactate permease
MWPRFEPLTLNRAFIVHFPTNKAINSLSIWWFLLFQTTASVSANRIFLFDLGPETPALLGLFRDFLCDILFNSTSDADCSFLTSASKAQTSLKVLNQDFPQECIRAWSLFWVLWLSCWLTGLLWLKSSVPAAVSFPNWIVSGWSVTRGRNEIIIRKHRATYRP